MDIGSLFPAEHEYISYMQERQTTLRHEGTKLTARLIKADRTNGQRVKQIIIKKSQRERERE